MLAHHPPAQSRSPLLQVWAHFRTALAPSTIIQCWLSSAALADAANNGYRAIFSVGWFRASALLLSTRHAASPNLRADDFYYLDYTGTTWDVMYDTDPLGGIPNVSAHANVLGGEAAMWGESVDASNVLGEPLGKRAERADWLGGSARHVLAAALTSSDHLAACRRRRGAPLGVRFLCFGARLRRHHSPRRFPLPAARAGHPRAHHGEPGRWRGTAELDSGLVRRRVQAPVLTCAGLWQRPSMFWQSATPSQVGSPARPGSGATT